MRLCALLILCASVCLLGVNSSPAHNDEHRSTSSTEDRPLKVTMEVDAPDPWSLSVGDSAVIRCSVVTDGDQDRAKQLTLSLEWITLGSIQVMATEPASKGISYTLGPVTLEDRGLYSCKGDNSNPNITVENDHKLIWVNDPSPTVSLELLRVNRVKYFYDKTHTIQCQLPNDGSEWKIFSGSEKTGSITECPDQERSGDLLSCTIPFLPYPASPSRKYDPFWCESSKAHKSNVLDLTYAEKKEQHSRVAVGTKFVVTPAWFIKAGDNVVFECDVKFDKHGNSEKFDLQLIWTQMAPGNNMTVLVSQQASKPISYTLSNITHEHQGVYSCWDDGTLSNIIVLHWHHFIWVEDDSPPVTINVLSHNRTQFFHNEEVTLGCQLPNDQSEWKLMGFNKWTGIIKECGNPELSPSRLLSCTEKMGYPWSDRVYWCESATGQTSNTVNLTNTVGFNVLEAPPAPVMEGDDVTLRCLQKNRATGEITPAPAIFRQNSVNVGNTEGESFTLKAVTKAKEGFYECHTPEEGETLKSWITVKARPEEQKKSD